MKFYKIYFILSTLILCQYTYSGCRKENYDELNEKKITRKNFDCNLR